MKIVEIALPLPLKKVFTYQIENNNEFDLIGRRVLVKFGSQVLSGVIVSVSTDSIADNQKPILEILDETPVFDENMLKLTKWISEYYYCSWGEALKAAIPQGLSKRNEYHIRLIQEVSDESINIIKRKSPIRAELLLELQKEKSVKISALEKRLDANLKSHIEYLKEKGIIEETEEFKQGVRDKFEKAVDLEAFDPGLINMDELRRRAKKQFKAITKFIELKNAAIPFVFLSNCMRKYAIKYTTIKALEDKGYITTTLIELDRSINITDDTSLSKRNELKLALTNEQKEVTLEVSEQLEKDEFKSFLLHGVTGSGKTLVYLHLIQKSLDLNKTVLILVPEISLTPQLIDRFERAFPKQIAVFHSKMSQGERYDSWKTVHAGTKKIVLGVRSALFSPLKNLGLIIIDEEHEHSFKQESPAPRYQARDAALYRARLENACVVLGSATPSLETYYNTMNNKHRLLVITERADNAAMPTIQTVDVKDARKSSQLYGPLTIDLLQKIEEKVEKKEGVILYLNRRGFSSVIQCRECGYIPECVHCSVVLTYHKFSDNLKCHYCSKEYTIIKSCPECGESDFVETGFGTQRIEEDIEQYFSEKNKTIRIERVDQDTTTKKGALKKALIRFDNGETDILIGTQMVAKGLDFDRVTLVGVINPDLQMFVPDFRAYERTFQLITQVSGRAGRGGDKPGEVLIQTSRPMSYAINSAINSDFLRFYEREIKYREKAKYPPFSRFCIIEFSGKKRDIVNHSASTFRRYLPDNNEYIEVLGPSEPHIHKIRDEFKWIIVVKGIRENDISGKKLRYYLDYAENKYHSENKSSTVKLKIDIDSYSAV